MARIDLGELEVASFQLELSSLARLGVGVRLQKNPWVRRRSFVMLRAHASVPAWRLDQPTERHFFPPAMRP